MLFKKNFLGEQHIEDLQVKYYIIHKNTYFGIAIEEKATDSIQCHHEYFTEDEKEAYILGNKMQIGLVTSTTMTHIIDDYVQ